MNQQTLAAYIEQEKQRRHRRGVFVNAVNLEGIMLTDLSLATVSPAASKKFMLSCWAYCSTTVAGDSNIMSYNNTSSAERLHIQIRADGKVRATVRNAANTLIARGVSAAGVAVTGFWTHILWSVDTTTGVERNQLWVNNIDAQASPVLVADGEIEGGLDEGLINSAQEEMWVSELWLDLENSLDLDVQWNRRRFTNTRGKPVDLGPKGEHPLGVAPFAYYPNPAATAHEDESGNANDLAATGGTPSLATTSPFR